MSIRSNVILGLILFGRMGLGFGVALAGSDAADTSLFAGEPGITAKQTDTAQVIYVEHVGPYWTLGPPLAELRKYMVRQGQTGSLYAKYLDDPLTTRAQALRTEIGFFVTGKLHPAAPYLSAKRGGELVAAVRIDEPYSHVSRQYLRLRRWASDHGYEPGGALTEIYHLPSGKNGHGRGLMEIQLPIRPISPTKEKDATPDLAPSFATESLPPLPQAETPAFTSLVHTVEKIWFESLAEEAKRPNRLGHAPSETPAEPTLPARSAELASPQPEPGSMVAETEPVPTLSEAPSAGVAGTTAHERPTLANEDGTLEPPESPSPSDPSSAPIPGSTEEEQSDEDAMEPATEPLSVEPSEAGKTAVVAEVAASTAGADGEKQFAEIAEQLFPGHVVLAPSVQVWSGQVVFRIRAVAKGVGHVYPGKGTSLRDLSKTLMDRYKRVSSASTRDMLGPAVIRVDRQTDPLAERKRKVMRDLDVLLVRIARRETEPDLALEQTLQIVQRVRNILADRSAFLSQKNAPNTP